MKPSVTVVVVGYNHAAYIVETLDSIRAQTYPVERLIVIDDASTDDTARVIQSWAATVDNADVHLRASNIGLCANLNQALATIRTPLYAYISGDDRMLPTRLERQIGRWSAHGLDAVAVYCDAHVIDNEGRRVGSKWSELTGWPGRSLEGSDLFEALVKENWLPAAGVLLDSEAVRRSGGYDEALFYEDHDLWIRLARGGGKFLCVDEPLVEFRALASSLGSTTFGDNSLKHQEARLRIMVKHFGVSAEIDQYLGAKVPALAVWLWEHGAAPDVVRRGLELTARGRATPGLTARLTLVRAGVTREPRAFRLARTRGH